MRFVIKHEIKGRIRVHIKQNRMTYKEADILQYYLASQPLVTSISVQSRTGDAIIYYVGSRDTIIDTLRSFQYDKAEVPEVFLDNSGRELNETYKEKLISKVVLRYGSRLFVPYPVRMVITAVKAIGYIGKGLKTLAKGKIEVPVLDATSIGVSMLRGDFKTAGSIMFLLGIGEILEEWTHKNPWMIWREACH